MCRLNAIISLFIITVSTFVAKLKHLRQSFLKSANRETEREKECRHIKKRQIYVAKPILILRRIANENAGGL